MVFFVLLVIAAYIGTPVLLTTGWISWSKERRPKDVLSWFSLIGFLVATASAAMALYSVGWSIAVGGFPYHDPRLLRLYGWGVLISFSAVLVSLPGLWRRNSLRWYAPGLAVCMLLVWFGWAVGE